MTIGSLLLGFLLASNDSSYHLQDSCSVAPPVRRPELAISVPEETLQKTRRILKQWEGDVLRSQLVTDSVNRRIMAQLDMELGSSLGPALLELVTQIDTTNESPLDWAAAFFYVKSGSAPDSLEQILLADDYPVRTRLIAFWARQEKSYKAISMAARRFVCQLVMRWSVRGSLEEDEADALARALVVLKGDSVAGNEDASDLLRSQSLVLAHAWLVKAGILPK